MCSSRLRASMPISWVLTSGKRRRTRPALTPVGFSISWCSSVTSFLFGSPVVPHWRSPSRPRHVILGGICEEVVVVKSGFDRKKVWVWLICAGPRLRLVRGLRPEHMKSRFLPVVVFAGLFRRFRSWPFPQELDFKSAIFLRRTPRLRLVSLGDRDQPTTI